MSMTDSVESGDRRALLGLLAAGAAGTLAAPAGAMMREALLPQPYKLKSWPLPSARRTGIHDVAPAPDGGVWFTAQASGHLGWFDPKSGGTELIALGPDSKPHGVIAGRDDAAWITDGGQNAIVRVAWPSRDIKLYRLPANTGYANLNTCAFDWYGDLWFTGQSGVIGKVDVKTGEVTAKPSPRGRGPYGICTTPKGDVWWCSLAGSFIARIDSKTGESTIVEPPTPKQGARRVWSDSRNRIWVSEWNSGNLSMYDTEAKTWRVWPLPGAAQQAYAVYVDDRDIVWVTDWVANALVRFDPAKEEFDAIEMPRKGASVRQLLGRPGEVWLPESGTEYISVLKT